MYIIISFHHLSLYKAPCSYSFVIVFCNYVLHILMYICLFISVLHSWMEKKWWPLSQMLPVLVNYNVMFVSY